MARIPYAVFDELEKDDKEFFKNIPELNVFRMLAHAGKTGTDCVKLGASILYSGELDPVLRELAIIRTGILRGSGYEVYQHKKIAQQLGIPGEKIGSLESGSLSPVFSSIERLVLKFTEEVVVQNKSAAETFSAITDLLGKRQVAELTITVGYYMLISSFLETFEVDIE